MILSRIMNYGCVFINKFHQASTVYSALNNKTLRPAQSVSFSSICDFLRSRELNNLTLTSLSPLTLSSRGMKVRAQLQLRCKNCYFARKEGRMYVMCSSYPRHSQMAKTKKPKYTWILTFASQSKKRPY